MKVLLNTLITLISITYPLLWLSSPESHLFGYLPFLLALLWLLKAKVQLDKQRWIAVCVGLFFAIIGATNTLGAMYWYPVIINAIMFILFASSLFSTQTIIERLVRLTQPDLPESAVKYIRNVVKVWCLFFGLNIIVVSSFILLKQYQYWAIYSGIIAYILMAILFVIEWLIRQHIMKK